MKKKVIKKLKVKSQDTGKFSNSEFFFDDCEICRGMKAAEEGKDLSLDDFEELFRKENKNFNKKRQK